MNSASNLIGVVPPIITSVGRNAPCSCGSGKRFKACHGAVPASDAPSGIERSGVASHRALLEVAAWAGLSREQRLMLNDKMHDALDALQVGEHASAEQSFRDVLGVAPDTADALSMLGVARFFLGDYTEAEQLIRRAISIAGSDPMYEGNLRLCLDRQRLETHARDGSYEAATLLLRECSATLAAVGETIDWAQLMREYAVGFVEFVGPDDVLSCGSWLLVAHLAAQLPDGVAFSLQAIRANGAPRIPMEIPGASQVSDDTPRLRVVIGAMPMSLIATAVVPSATSKTTVVLIDRDQPEDVLDLIFNLGRLGVPWRVVATNAYIAAKTGFPLLAPSAPAAASPPPEAALRRRLAVFVPDIESGSAVERWRLIEEIRRVHPAVDLLYTRPLPAEHLPSAGEHLISIVDARLPTLSTHWHSLLFWGGGRDWQQFAVLLRAFVVPNVIAHVATGALTPRTGQNVHYFCNAEQAIQTALQCARLAEQQR